MAKNYYYRALQLLFIFLTSITGDQQMLGELLFLHQKWTLR